MTKLFCIFLIIKTKLKITLLTVPSSRVYKDRYLLKEYYYFIKKIFAAFLIFLCDLSNDLLQSVSKNSLFAPVHTLKINPLENKYTRCYITNNSTTISGEKETNNVSSTAFILYVTSHILCHTLWQVSCFLSNFKFRLLLLNFTSFSCSLESLMF